MPGPVQQSAATYFMYRDSAEWFEDIGPIGNPVIAGRAITWADVQGNTPVAVISLVVGLASASLLMRLLRSLLFGVSPFDPMSALRAI